MKRKTLLVVMLLMAMLNTFAQEVKGVSFVSYEQTWLDDYGTLALKNNTKEPIFNISFQIIYTDMNNNPVDYKDFFEEVDIKPGMVKKLNIPAYERSRYYEYYKNTSGYSDHKRFKIQFKLQAINLAENPDPDTYEETMEPEEYAATAILIGIVVILFILGLSIGLYVLVAVMAKHRHRNIVLWVLLSIFITPIITIIILLFVGNEDQYQSNEGKLE